MGNYKVGKYGPVRKFCRVTKFDYKDPVNSHTYTKPSKFIRDSKKIILKRLSADQLLN